MNFAFNLLSIYMQYYQVIDMAVYTICFTAVFKIALTDFFNKDPPTLVLVATILGLYLSLYVELQMNFRLFELGPLLYFVFILIIFAAVAKKFFKFGGKSFYRK